jgi:hypothetical protein
MPIVDDAEIQRMRKAIRTKYAGSPHKRRTYLALLEQQVAAQRRRDVCPAPAAEARPSPPRVAHQPKR